MTTYEKSSEKEEGIKFNSDGTAIVTKRSLLSNTMHKATLKMTFKEYGKWFHKGGLIQDVLPHLTKEEREFLMTGATPEEWDKAFKDDENENKSVP